ncbi:sulfite exporter TauE/SafE family protein [Paraflavitalea sp. CAU 1676]|uniref:sulfite exporter TauE/SafE family protein n=1 Tax=Paraflavitalea sp. CAU 1676 TaxID=3032598 RepID=UPI0023DAEC87|nr:sulfite exporter TauE/SafE family protein [Paraflavitalea sp. CAU 1676]MDF2190867.1 sulfite exporter TauE/SafE family protein [Paraflavitalea sp. CAU 1676]
MTSETNLTFPHFFERQESMEIAGYIIAVLIGLSLGLIGGGGSIITVPVLVYLLKVDPVLATMYSLFVVGCCSLVGSVRAYRKNLVDIPVVFVFGSASMLSVFIARHHLVPLLPNYFFNIGPLAVTKPVFLMLMFSLLMLLTSISMIRNARNNQLTIVPAGDQPRKMLPLFLQGAGVGIITGILGAGGGFLIIPALVLFGKVPMKTAVGSSLTIMTFSSLFGFFSTMAQYQIHWPLLMSFTAIAIGGIFVGMSLSDKISAGSLRKVFGWFVLSIGILVLVHELFFSA